MSRPRTVYINESYRPQRVSGQQRYAREISERLPAEFVRVEPRGIWARSKLLTWLWVQTVLPLQTWRGVLLSMTARAPLWHPRAVLVVHDLFPIEHPEWFSRSFHLTHAPLLRIQLATSAALLAVSEPVAKQLRTRGRTSRVLVAPNAPSAVFSADVDVEGLLSKWSLGVGGYLVCVGTLEPRKNLLRLAEAYGRLSPEERSTLALVVVGGGAEVHQLVDAEWPDEVVVTGYVTDEELVALYAGSAGVVFPSLAEGFGLPIVEAVRAGTRGLIVSDIEVFHWICGDAAEYVDPLSIDSIADAMRRAVAGGLPTPTIDPTRFTWDKSADIVRKTCEGIA